MFPGELMINSLFWMLFGVLQMFVIAGIYAWASTIEQVVSKWKVAVLYTIFALFLLTIGGGFTLAGEYESQAGWYFIGFLGTPLIISFAIAVKLFYFKEAKPA